MNITTHHTDAARTGANLSETTLTVANVRANFGRLFERKVNGATYAQPLYVAGVQVRNVGMRNVLYIATMRNMVYAFDADAPTASTPLWGPVSLGPYIHLPDPEIGWPGFKDIEWDVGVVGTPVIDLGRSALFVVATTKDGNAYAHRLHKIDLRSGALARSAAIAASAGGARFDSRRQNQRPGLVLANDRIYAGFGGYNDRTPYHGWIIAFDPETLAQREVFCSTPNEVQGEGGIWMAGEALAVDGAGDLYFMTGNGSFNGTGNNPTDFGTCFVKLLPDLRVVSWFSPFNNASLGQGGADADLGSAGILLIPGTSLLIGGGKEGKFYLLDQKNLGGFHAGSDSQIRQSFFVNQNHHIHGCPTVWTGPMGTFVYVWPEVDVLRAYRFAGDRFVSNTSGQVLPAALGTTGFTPGMPGGFLSISANGGRPGTGIVWANHPWAEDANQKIVDGVLRAYDASNLNEIWDSRNNRARDDFGNFAKFCPPTVTNGKVYLPTMGGLHRKVTIWDDTAREGLALADLNDNILVMAWTGTDSPGHLNVRWTSDGINWPGKATNGNETSWHGPSLAAGLGRIFMAWTGTDRRLNVHTSNDCVNWFNKKTLDETSDHAPALAFGNGKLFLAWTGTDADRSLNVISSTDGLTWGNKVTLGDSSPNAPGLAFFDGTLFLLWCGTDANHKLNIMQSPVGVNWSNKVTLSDASDSAPAMAVDGGGPFLCWRGRGNQLLNQMTPGDSNIQHFTDKRTFYDMAIDRPALAEFKNRMYVAWPGTDNPSHLNVAVLSLGGVSAYGLL